VDGRAQGELRDPAGIEIFGGAFGSSKRLKKEGKVLFGIITQKGRTRRVAYRVRTLTHQVGKKSRIPVVAGIFLKRGEKKTLVGETEKLDRTR